MERVMFLLFFIVIPTTNGAVPGTFFWKPRLGLDLAIPTTVSPMVGRALPTKKNIELGLVVQIEGYEAGMTMVALASGLTSVTAYPHLDLMRPYFYTNAYRWALRHLSLLPVWVGGSGGAYVDSHKVWNRRFFYMDEFLPKWARYLFPFIKSDEWTKEIKEFKRYKKLSESAFGKHYRFPSKMFNDFKSQDTEESTENLENSASSSLSPDR